MFRLKSLLNLSLVCYEFSKYQRNVAERKASQLRSIKIGNRHASLISYCAKNLYDDEWGKQRTMLRASGTNDEDTTTMWKYSHLASACFLPGSKFDVHICAAHIHELRAALSQMVLKIFKIPDSPQVCVCVEMIHGSLIQCQQK